MADEGEGESIEAGGPEERLWAEEEGDKLWAEVDKRRPISVTETVGHSASLGFIAGTCLSPPWLTYTEWSLLTKVGGLSNAKLAKRAVSHGAVSIQIGGGQLRWLMAKVTANPISCRS